VDLLDQIKLVLRSIYVILTKLNRLGKETEEFTTCGSDVLYLGPKFLRLGNSEGSEVAREESLLVKDS
jgi:hypothetical protein